MKRVVVKNGDTKVKWMKMILQFTPVYFKNSGNYTCRCSNMSIRVPMRYVSAVSKPRNNEIIPLPEYVYINKHNMSDFLFDKETVMKYTDNMKLQAISKSKLRKKPKL